MASLQSHKRRIKSIDSTANIARAMELVSSVKMRKLKNKYEESIDYLENISRTINEVLSLQEYNGIDIEKGKIVTIVITSNLGLCGPYNELINKQLEKDESDAYITFGEKGRKYLEAKKKEILYSYKDYDDDSLCLDEMMEYLKQNMKNNQIKEINVIYTKFINNLRFNVVKEQIYPFEIKQEKNKIDYLVEPNNEEMIKRLKSLYVQTKTKSVLLNSLLSENASRNNAMKNAKDNAEDLKKELTIVYNKLRQQQITNELSDIVNGN